VSRAYNQFCPVARVLDVVGERWSLLIVRELLLGPRRFTDLAQGLPGIGTSVLTTRLKKLEQDGLVARRTLPAPAASVVYDLTADALGLATILAAMADWGMTRLGRAGDDDQIQGRWLVLSLAVTTKRAQSIPDATYELRIDDDILHIRAFDGHLQPSQGPVPNPDATITMSAGTLAAIASGELDIPSSQAEKLITLDGDTAGARRLLEIFSGPRSV
jgi:DNA-binding HxlR family transcriptional regulator